MLSLARRGYHGPMAFGSGPETESERNMFKYRSLREQLERSLLEKLRTGVLIASGYDARDPLDGPRVTIPSDRWRVLKANFVETSATMPGVTITDILVWEPPAAAESAVQSNA